MENSNSGRGNGGRGSRSPRQGPRGGRGNRSQRPSNNNNKKPIKRGECEELKDNVFDYDVNNPGHFIKSKEKMIEHVQRTFTRGQDICETLKTGKRFDFDSVMPSSPTPGPDGTVSEAQQIVHTRRLNKHADRIDLYEDNLTKAFGLILGQCTPRMRNKLEARKDWHEIESNHDPVQLLNTIRDIIHNTQDHQYGPLAAYNALKTFIKTVQEEREGLTSFHKKFEAACEALEVTCGPICMESLCKHDPGWIDPEQHADFDIADWRNNQEIMNYNWERFKAIGFQMAADQKRSGKFNEDLANMYTLGTDRYPDTLLEAKEAVQNYQNKVNRPKTNNNNHNYRNNGNTRNESQSTFAQRGNNKHAHLTCNHCKEKGHIRPNCPKLNNSNQQGQSHAQNSEQQQGQSQDNSTNQNSGNNNNNSQQQGNNNTNSNNSNSNGRSDTQGRQGFQRGANFFGAHGLSATQVEEDTDSDYDDDEPPDLLRRGYDSDGPYSSSEDSLDEEEWRNMRNHRPIARKKQKKTVVTAATSTDIAGHQHLMKQDDLMHKVLLDSESTCHLWANPEYVEAIYDADNELHLETNGGVAIATQKATIPYLTDVWFSEKAMTNILSLAKIREGGYHDVTYDIDKGQFVMTNLQTGKVTIFKQEPSGLHTAPLDPDMCLLQTVEHNKSLYSKRQVAKADRAKALYYNIGTPSMEDFKHLIKMGSIQNCPVVLEDVQLMEKIYGKDIPTLKGKTVRKKPQPVVSDYVEVPKELIEAHQGIILCADIMYVEKLAFLVTISIDLKYITIKYVPNRETSTLLAAVDETLKQYNKAELTVKEFRADNEFEPLRDHLENSEHCNITCNLVAAQEHEPNIERCIRLIKERFRVLWHMMPYSCIPRIMIIRGLQHCVRCLNAFPPKGGISQAYSPRAIITGKKIDYNKHCKIGFGSYVQAITQNEPSNTVEERTIDGIVLRTLDTHQGGYEVLNLRTGDIITRHHVIEVPAPQGAIERVEALAKKEGYRPHAAPAFEPPDALIAGVDDDNFDDDATYYSDEDENYGTPTQQEHQNYPTEDEQSDQTSVANEEEEESDFEDQQPQPLRRSTRESKQPELLQPTFEGKSYQTNHLQTQSLPEETLEYSTEEAKILVDAFVLLQNQVNEINSTKEATKKQELAAQFAQTYSLMKGIKKFGDRGTQAAIAEMKQLHDRMCFHPIDINKLPPDARRKAMRSLIFLTEKRDGRIKARTCADGSTQRTWINKDEAGSPTVMMESIFLSATIDAKEGREVAVVDIPNAFILTPNEKLRDWHETDIMKIRGKLAEMLVEIDPTTYAPYVTYENGVPVLYVEIWRALYGMIKSPLLFYRKLRKDLEEAGFTINPYDICVANKDVDGKQLTVMWHVDDLKVSSVSVKAVDDFIQWAIDKYEDKEITKLKPSRGKVHDYLGITLDYSTPGVVRIYMKDYVAKMLEEFPNIDEVDALKHVSTPAADHLFQVRDKAPTITDEKKEVFHTTVAKGLFLCKRARPDLQPTIPFLCTRVKQPDLDDWKKLLRMLKYMKQTKDMELTLEAAEGDILLCHWYPDAAFAVHPDMKSHTGGILTLGKGAVNTFSAKQKLNTRSSTEAELVGADDIMPQAIWTKNFLEAQGYECSTTIYQDNTSTILLQNNGRESSSKRTRHLNIRYFFITDCIAKKMLQVKYCPTDEMIGDYPSKPLQGAKFKKHRRSIMNLKGA